MHLEVSRGPEAGKAANFYAPVVTIGRSPKNDLVLQDGLVSQYHGELVLRPKGYIYRDLRSRHGTLVKLHHVTVNLHNRQKTQEISLIDGAQLMLGESIIRIHVDRVEGAQPASPPAANDSVVTDTADPLLDEHIVTRSQDSLEAVTKKLSRQDPRLVSIFKLSRQLNAAPDLVDILELMVECTFEAFPAANFFAITPVDEGHGEPVVQTNPLVSRERGQEDQPSHPPLLSQSLLQQVADTHESVLFVRDEAGSEVSQSIVNARITACLAAPLIGERHLIGVMQADTRGLGRLFAPDDLDLFTVMASYAAFAIERVRLNDSIVAIFEDFVRASVSAVDARDPSTAGHSARVADLTMRLANAVRQTDSGPLANARFTEAELKELRYAALLHDFGKIGVRESVLGKALRLYPADRKALLARLEAYRNKLAFDVHKRTLRDLVAGQEQPTADTLAALDEQLERINTDVDDIRDFLLSQLGQPSLAPEVIEHIHAIAKRTYTSLDETTEPLLGEDELEHLTVKDGTLTPAEWDHMRSHANMSRDYLGQIPWSDDLARIPELAGQHHEKLDGSGYPDGIRGDRLSLQVRILTICDVFDAMTAADRPYRKAMTVAEAVAALRDEASRGLLDTDLVELFYRRVVTPLLQTATA